MTGRDDMAGAHDPTRAGAPVPDHAAQFSRSEIEAMCLKAAHGAGLPWGLAEEAGWAARRLAEAGLPGPEWVLACLEGPRGAAPVVAPGQWRPGGPGTLCPIATGAALSDHAHLLEMPLRLGPVAQPGLLLPFLMRAAARLGALHVAWAQGAACVTAKGLAAPHAPPDEAELTITTADSPPEGLADTPPLGGRRVPLALWRRLDALALATTVPPSAASRAGAGSTAGDND